MILKALAERDGEVVSRDELLDKAWGYELYPSTPHDRQLHRPPAQALRARPGAAALLPHRARASATASPSKERASRRRSAACASAPAARSSRSGRRGTSPRARARCPARRAIELVDHPHRGRPDHRRAAVAQVAGKAFFTKEIEEALRGRPRRPRGAQPEGPARPRCRRGLALGAVLEREDPRDVLLACDAGHPGDAAARRAGRHQQPAAAGAGGARAPRRSSWSTCAATCRRASNACSTRAATTPSSWPRPASSGSAWSSTCASCLPFERFLPAVAQGAVAVEVRGGDAAHAALGGARSTTRRPAWRPPPSARCSPARGRLPDSGRRARRSPRRPPGARAPRSARSTAAATVEERARRRRRSRPSASAPSWPKSCSAAAPARSSPRSARRRGASA